jgi:ribosomal protein S18 acetylase RimI-like enzyme
MQIERVTTASDEVVQAIARLLPQTADSAIPGPAEVQAIVSDPACTLFVARDPHIVGMLTLVHFRTPTGHHAWIEDVVVDGAFRGRGIGEALTRAGLDLARELGVREVNLTTRPAREAANRLYQRLGFQQRQTNVYRYPIEK